MRRTGLIVLAALGGAALGVVLGGLLRNSADTASAAEGPPNSVLGGASSGPFATGAGTRGRGPASGQTPKSTDELVAMEEAARLSYLLERLAHDPEGAVREALELDRREGTLDGPLSLTKWLLERLARDNPELAERVLARMEMTGLERRELANLVARTERVSHDPAARVDGILNGAKFATRGDLYTPLIELAATDPAAAMDAFERALRERPETLAGVYRSLEAIAAIDPDRFAQLYREARHVSLKRSMGNALAAVLGERDPAAGRELLESMPLSRHRSLAAIHFAEGWGRTDPAAAVRWAQTELQGLVRLRAMAAAIPREYVSRHPEEVIAWFREIPEFPYLASPHGDLDERRALTSEGDSGVGRGELHGIVTASDILRQALLDISETDPRTALEAAEGMGEASFSLWSRGTLRGRIAGEWAAREPESALQWLGEQSGWVREGVAQTSEFREAFGGMEAGALREAILLASGIEGERQREVISAMLSWVARRSPEELLQLADSLPPAARVGAAEPLIDSLADSHPWRAAEELHRLGDEQRGVYEEKIVIVASRDSAGEAMAFVEGLPEARRTERMYDAILPEWVAQEWEAAREWYMELPEGPVRDRAMPKMEIQRFVHEEIEPQEALARVMTAKERGSLLLGLFRTWHRRDAEAARSALEAAELLEGERRTIERFMGR